jgi:hypothetical protein
MPNVPLGLPNFKFKVQGSKFKYNGFQASAFHPQNETLNGEFHGFDFSRHVFPFEL